MKTLTKVLTGFGALAACILVFAGFMAFRAAHLGHAHEPFVRKFMFDYSRRWDPADVYGRLTTDFLDQIKSPAGEQAVSFFKRLGRLQQISDMSLQKFYVGTDGNRFAFKFKARFEAAPTVVDLTVIDRGGQVRVAGLHITPATQVAPLKAAHSPI